MAVILKNKTPFAKGSNRECYVHPYNPMRCIKVIRNPYFYSKRGFFTALLRFLKLAIYTVLPSLDENRREYRYYKRISKIEGFEKFFPKCYGILKTDIGYALEYDLIKDSKTGQVSKTINREAFKNRLKDRYSDSYITSANNLISFIKENKISLRDIAGCNISARLIDHENVEIFIVDGIGRSKVDNIAKLENILLG